MTKGLKYIRYSMSQEEKKLILFTPYCITVKTFML